MKKIFLTSFVRLSFRVLLLLFFRQDFTIAAKHAIAVEANTGKILYLRRMQRNLSKLLP